MRKRVWNCVCAVLIFVGWPVRQGSVQERSTQRMPGQSAEAEPVRECVCAAVTEAEPVLWGG